MDTTTITFMPNFVPVDFDPFGDALEIEKVILTNESQREIWLACIMADDANLSYNESVSLEIKGSLNFEALKRAVNDLILRHEALRSTISPNGETLIIYRDFPIDFDQQDISALNPDEQKENLKAFIRKEMVTPFDLYGGPLFRASLHKLSDVNYFFTIVKHHAIGDGWSTGIILEDLSKMYNAYSKGNSIHLDRPYQISDYVKAQTSFKLTKAYKETEKFWIDIYKDHVPVLDLPTDHPRPSIRTYKGNRIDYPLPKAFIDKIKAVGAKSGCSLVTTLLATFEVFLFQKTGQKDIVVGLPSSGQSASELYDLVGNCVNLLPLKSTINTNQPFADYLKKRKGEVLDAYDHQRLTFGELIKKLYISRDNSRITLVPVVFNIDMGMDNSVAFDNLEYKLISNPREYENFEVFLNATGSKDGLTLEWSYNAGLFTTKTIEKFNEDYVAILEKIIMNPDITTSELTGNNNEFIFTPADEVNIPSTTTINTLIADSIKSYATKTAVSFNDHSLTYYELDEKVEQFTSYLINAGIKSGDIVGISVERSAEMLIALLAVLRAGAVYLPLDPEFPLDRIEFMLEDSAAKILLTSARYKNRYKTTAHEIVIDEIWAQLDSYQQASVNKIDGNDLAYILYTSGSTGKPKGVKISHHNLANFLLSMQATPGIKATDRLLAITTISFDIAGLELYLPLITGAEIVLADDESIKDGRLLLKIVEEKNITMMQATPSTWQMMLDSGWEKRFPVKILSGGEGLPKDLANKLLNLSVELWNMYGPTETTIWSTVKKITTDDKLITVGFPIYNTQIYIVDEHGKQLPAKQEGEIYIGGEGVAEGYLNRDELTAEKFVNDTFSDKPDSKLYRTGDLGKVLDNGEIQCLGRIDHQVKIRGHRIELGEIESIIAKQDGVKQAVVLAREDTPMDKRLIAYVTFKEDLDTISQAWKDHWDTLYEIGAETKQNLDIADQNIDGTLLEHLDNSEDLKKQAAEWLQTSVKRIKELNAKRVYEIGSGAGQILFEVAPGIEYYMATDYAQAAISNINGHLIADPKKWAHVEASAAPADDFSAIGDTSVDLVLVHSVAQYFPNADYLIRVIKESIRSIKQGGCIFIGDMQGKNSLEMCHAMDYLPRASDSTTLGSFKDGVVNRVRIEEEFVADPAFFYLLPSICPEITGVDVQLRKGQSVNETTKYHYDVWLYVETSVEKVKSQVVNDWKEVNTIANAEKLLLSNQESVVEIKNILNIRTAKDLKLLQLLHSASPDTSLLKIKNTIESVIEGIHPDLFWQLGDKLNYKTHVRWTTDGTDGLFDVIFIPASDKIILPESTNSTIKADLHNFARAPLSKNDVAIPKEIIQDWRNNLNELLPAYMVPEDFIGLKSFPLTPNAKVDRKALPKPPAKTSTAKVEERRDLTENEQLVTNIWAESLGLNNLKPNDDFFELGGHSLLAVRVMVAIEKATGKRLPLATLFDNSTIEKLARKLSTEDNADNNVFDAVIAIKPTGSKPPLFFIHGGGLNVLFFQPLIKYFDEDQPLYGIQAVGLTKETEVPDTIEGIAHRYVEEMLLVDPIGPYSLVGYSLGGIFTVEIARHLEKMGKEVKLLGVIDTYVRPPVKNVNGLQKVSNKILRQFQKIPFFVESFVKYPKDAFMYQLLIAKSKILNLFSTYEPDAGVDVNMFTDYERKIYDVYKKALSTYTLTPFNMKITLFRAEKRIYYLDDRVFLGWNKFAKRGVDIYPIPGDHQTFMYPPNDKNIAKLIQNILDADDQK